MLLNKNLSAQYGRSATILETENSPLYTKVHISFYNHIRDYLGRFLFTLAYVPQPNPLPPLGFSNFSYVSSKTVQVGQPVRPT